ncbi:MAG: PTS sugar transporter subunit IIA, partial [Opitutaceae bacterium]
GSGFDAVFIETFVYSVIAATVILQGFSAGFVARLLGLRKAEATGWLVVGAHRLGCEISAFLARSGGVEVTVVDSNPRLTAEAESAGLQAIHSDALDVEVMRDDERFQRVGHVLAITDNVELNELVCQRWREHVGRDHLFRWGAGRAAPASPIAPTLGRVVLERLPRPALLSAELRRGEAVISETPFSENETPPPDAHVLAAARKDVVVVDPLRADFAFRPGDRLLVIRRAGAFLVRGLLEGGVVDLGPASVEALHGQLASQAAQFEPRINARALLADLVERERVMSTFLGHGVGVPHAFVKGLTRRIVVLGRVREGIAVPDQAEPVTLLFLIVSPPGDPEGHLSTLADVARLCASDDAREKLRAASDPEGVVAIVRTALE